MISLRGIEKSYKTGAGVTYVLRRVNLEIKEGEFITVMGPSGAGKSTMLSIVGSPKLILADEPTGNLHSSQAREIMELFKRLNDEGTTIIQVTHSEVNASYGNRVIQLFDGWITGEEKVAAQPATV